MGLMLLSPSVKAPLVIVHLNCVFLLLYTLELMSFPPSAEIPGLVSFYLPYGALSLSLSAVCSVFCVIIAPGADVVVPFSKGFLVVVGC